MERISGLGLVPRAMIMVSTSSSNSLPSLTMGRRRPEASGSPSSISTQVMPFTQPFSSPRTSTGLVSRLEDDALFLGMLDFFLTGRQFGHAAAVYNVHLLGTQALGAAGCVHGDVAAAHKRQRHGSS